MGFKNFLASLKSGWEDWRVLLAARDDDDDDYNFTSGSRHGMHGSGYNFTSGPRRGAELYDDDERDRCGDGRSSRSSSCSHERR
ncbi:hypothetical protein MPH_10317 [Macrophomina phaseolina MS6]|uniref:Uncharacterized protein n=1 Tax=Macrophomina phaseolina (strain MS6) TaxID=1126212 RepID=K2RIC0_MACPH|nr:hypothetical protein MPH_10317 [Macrophomina phaseolina MS6]